MELSPTEVAVCVRDCRGVQVDFVMETTEENIMGALLKEAIHAVRSKENIDNT